LIIYNFIPNYNNKKYVFLLVLQYLALTDNSFTLCILYTNKLFNALKNRVII